MTPNKLTYAKSGVDIIKEDHAIKALARHLTYTRTGIGKPLTNIGHYAGLIDFGEYALAMTTDGVGSKILVANALKKWDTIGIDLIAMNVNDLLAMGIEPIALVDYIAIEHPNPEIMEQIGIGLKKGAELANISIVGGETATLPEIVNGFDLAGSCLGIAKKEDIITGEKIEIGDAIIGLPSSGIHSNGLTLARKVIEQSDYSYFDEFPYHQNSEKTIGEELLTPTKIYIEVLNAIKEADIHGFAHITGSGLLKLKRLTRLGFDIYNPLEPQPIFKFLQEQGNIDIEEMYRTFNCGMGFVIITPKQEANKVINIVGGKIVGEIVEEGITIFQCNL
ncbi:MAG: phosphoribosylformylglycinamidine cyclo-ligase [Methanosarcinales archaeon]